MWLEECLDDVDGRVTAELAEDFSAAVTRSVGQERYRECVLGGGAEHHVAVDEDDVVILVDLVAAEVRVSGWEKVTLPIPGVGAREAVSHEGPVLVDDLLEEA